MLITRSFKQNKENPESFVVNSDFIDGAEKLLDTLAELNKSLYSRRNEIFWIECYYKVDNHKFNFAYLHLVGREFDLSTPYWSYYHYSVQPENKVEYVMLKCLILENCGHLWID